MSISNKLLPKAFAENAGSTYRYDITDTNDTEFKNKATYDKGFPAVTMTDIAAGGIPPFGQDMNGILFDLTTAIRYLQAGNLARYDASFAAAIGGYLKNAVVSDLDANQYRSLKDNNTEELTDTTAWVQIDALEKGIGGTVTGNTNFTGKLQNNGSDVVTKAMNAVIVGEIRLLGFRSTSLPKGWYFANGDNYSVSSDVGKALLSLSDEFKSDWNIVVTDDTINLPNLFAGPDGVGTFLRSVAGIDRQVGSYQGDAIRDITGTFNPSNIPGKAAQGQSGAFVAETFNSGYGESGSGSNGAKMTFAASRVVPTAKENRPINLGMTPAIYLGV